MGYTKRKSFGRFQFIFDAGFDKEDFGVELSALYLDPWEIGGMQMMGFWCVTIELFLVKVTINITDKTFRRDKMRYRPTEKELL